MKERKLLSNRRVLAVILALTMTMSLFGNFGVLAEREYEAEVSIMGTAVQLENIPYSEYGAVFAPLEELCGYIGIAVSKDGDIYTMTRAGHSVQLQVGNMYAKVDGIRKDLAFSPALRSGVLYVPMEFFSLCFDIPVSVDADSRSADITPNVYAIRIDEQHAAAVKAENPDEDALVTTATGADILRDHMDYFPGKSSYVYYKASTEFFNNKKILSASLVLKVKRNETGPSVTAVRTAPWNKGEITWNNQPAVYAEKSKAVKVSDSAYTSINLDIESLIAAANLSGEELSLKLLGTHREDRANRDKYAYAVQGVNTVNAPYIKVAVEETYNFPVKEAVQEDTDDENRYSEMGILRSLGVFTEEDEFPLDFNEGVMRWEFIRYALRLANAQIVKGSSQHFSDVPSDAPFFDEVNTAREQGYIAGDAGIAFRPYDFITLGEAITVMGRILNYDVYAEERGGYTPGYFDAARIGELYMGAATATKALSFNELFKILRNALDAAILEVTTYSSNGTAEYIFNENKNILTEYWNAKVIEGTVTKNEYSDLRNPAGSGKENTIYIDSKELKLLYKEYNNFLGYRVKGWYDNDDRLLYMGIKEYDITEIDLTDVTGDSVSGSTVNFTYERANGSNASESFSVGSGKYVIYNGKSIASGDLKKMLLSKADGGSIKLIGDSLTVIEAYRTIVVGSVDTNEEVIYDKYDLYNRVLRLKDADYFFKNDDGSNAELKEITSNDVLSVAESTDGKYVNAIICREQVSGTIGMIENGDDLENAVVSIDGKEYTLANATKPLLSNTGGKYWTDFVKLNTSATFILDSFGSIVSVLDTQTEAIPGYVVAMGYKGGLSKQLQAAIMVKEHEKYQIYEFANNVKYNGTKKKEADVKKYFHEGANENNAFVEKAVLFDVNAEGEISKIDTFITKAEADAYTTSEVEQKLVQRYTGSDLFYKSGSGVFGNLFYWKADTTLCVVTGNEASYEDYVSYQKNWSNDTKPNVVVYTKGARTPETCIVVVNEKKPGSTVSETAPMVVVDRLVKAFDSDGMEVDKIYYWESPTKLNSAIVTEPEEVFYYETKKNSDGTYVGGVTFSTKIMNSGVMDDTKFDKHPVTDLERGDIIRVARTADGIMGGVVKLYDYGDHKLNDKYNGFDSAAMNDEGRFLGGYANMIEGNYLCMTPENNPGSQNETDRRWFDSTQIPSLLRYEVSSSGVELIEATISDVRTYESVPYAPSGIIVQTSRETPKGNSIIIELPQPTGTGQFYVDYNPGTRPDATGMPADGGVNNPFTLPAAPDGGAGWTFKAWEIDGVEYAAGDTYPLSKSVTTITALWEEVVTYKVTFDGNGIRENGEKNLQFNEESTLLPAEEFTKDGYKLIGWKDEGGTIHDPGEYYKHTVEGSVTFTAVWAKAEEKTVAIGDMEFMIATKGDSGVTVANYNKGKRVINAGANEWLLVRIKVGENWILGETAMKLTTYVHGGSNTDTDYAYVAPLTKAEYDAATALVAPSVAESKDTTSKAGQTKPTLAVDLTSSFYGENNYVGEYLYLAIQYSNTSKITLFADSTFAPKWKLTLDGYKTMD